MQLKELDQVIMVLREPSSITRRTFDEACAQAKVNPRVLLELDSREAVTEAVAAELGVGVVSSVEVSHDPRVAAVPIIGEGLVNRHMIGCMERRRDLRLIQAFFGLALPVRLESPASPAGWLPQSLRLFDLDGKSRIPVGASLLAMGPDLPTQDSREPSPETSPPLAANSARASTPASRSAAVCNR